MHTNPNPSLHWSPYHALTITAVWVALVVLIAFALCGCGGSTPPSPANGSISLAWSITIADTNGQPATCAQVGARSVALRLRNRTGGNIVATAFPCEGSPGTAQVATGVYDVAIELHAPDGTRLATAPDQTGVAIVAGRVKTLTPVTFTVSAQSTQGTMVLSIATPATTNCQPTASGGAGITALTLTLQHTGDGCAPVTFVRRRGTEQRGTYTVVCSSPNVAPCIEKDETLTTSLDAGSYIVRARGKIGAIDCWQRDDTLEVPPGKPLIRTLGLMHVNNPGC